jgi:hypothetical protein
MVQGGRVVSLFRIPNVVLGRVGNRALVRLFLPGMYEPGQGGGVPGETDGDPFRRRLYDEVIGPALKHAYNARYNGNRNAGSGSAHRVPLSYDLGQDRLPPNTNAVTTVQIPVAQLEDFATDLFERLDTEFGQAAAEDAFFLHEIQGVKDAYNHRHDDAHARMVAVTRALSVFDPNSRPFTDLDGANADQVPLPWEGELWFIDVALQYSVDEHIVHWRTDGGDVAFQVAYPGLPRALLLQEYNTRRIDSENTMSDISGWFYQTKGREMRRRPEYLATCYSTAKVFWSHRSNATGGGLYAQPMPWEVTTQTKFDALDVRAARVSANLVSASGDAPSAPQAGSARLEVRVPMTHATTALSDPEGERDDLVRSSLAVYSPNVWW